MSDQHNGLSDHREHPGQETDGELGYYARRAQAMEALLVEKAFAPGKRCSGRSAK